MNIPKDLKYTKNHEWVKELPDGGVRIGLSDYAQSELGDLVFVSLPQPGDALTAGQSFGDVESVKAVSDVYSPVSGVVTAVNESLADTPEAINGDCYAAWLIEAGEISAWGEVMDAGEYQALITEEG